MLSKHKAEKQCLNCKLCGSTSVEHSYHTHFGSLTTEIQGFVIKHFPKNYKSTLTETDCICKAHYVEALRHHNEDQYIPVWSKHKQQKGKKQCSYPECKTPYDRVITPSFLNTESTINLTSTAAQAGHTITLCNGHYQLLYRQERQYHIVPCVTCGAKPLRGTMYNRHCPNPELIMQHMNTNMGVVLEITPEDKICSTCYKLHSQIINGSKSESKDSELQTLIEQMQLQKDATTDKTEKAILTVSIFVASELLLQKALLLPNISRLFLKEYGVDDTSDMYNVQIETETEKIKYKSNWLLAQMSTHLGHHLSYKCIHRKFGVVLLRKNGDLLTSLSWALGTRDTNYEPSHYDINMSTTSTDQDTKRTLEQASSVLNELLHQEIQNSAEHKKAIEDDPEAFNIDNHIQLINPLLWSFIEKCTLSKREKQSHQQSKHLEWIKRLRRYYVICQLQSCCNTEITLPIHNILADVVQVCGGSRVLLHILNHLGCTSSPDTYDRFVTSQALKQRESSIWSTLSKHTFTVVSADNFDLLQTHAAVYCGDQNRSYHATTIQAVQPYSHLRSQCTCTHTDGLLPMSPEPLSNRRQHSNSPLSSPHVLGKGGPKRRRTISPHKLSSRHQFTPSADHQSVAMFTDLQVARFVTNDKEKKENDKMSVSLLKYITLKYMYTQDSTCIPLHLQSIKSFMCHVSLPVSTPNSKILYLELIDENPDSLDTLTHVADQLLQKLKTECQDDYVLLIGDGKTYQHLIKIKRSYKSAMKKLLIYPGDWHMLKNFQEVLMKQYFHSGLKEIANESGFRSSTLKSLETCSHFKRTHRFLLQVWEAMYHALLESTEINRTGLLEFIAEENSIEDSTIIETKCLSFLSQLEDNNKHNKLVKYWTSFVMDDCLAYIELYLAIRSGNWDLRLYAIKKMVPLFFAFDQNVYMELITHHLAELSLYPDGILNCLKQGGFTVSFTGDLWCRVAIDEAHEMGINKDLKSAVIRPTTEYLQKTSIFFNYRITSYKNFTQQVLSIPSKKNEQAIPQVTAQNKKDNENINTMYTFIKDYKLFCAGVPITFGNVFTKVEATPQQVKDMLSFRDIGSNAYLSYVKSRIINEPSTKAPVRKQRLLTMAPVKAVSKKKMNEKERELKNVSKYLRRRLEWCRRTGQAYDPASEQYSVYPRALCDSNGNPHSGSKSVWLAKLNIRYQTGGIVTNALPLGWTPEAVIIDAMFLLASKPLRGNNTILLHSKFLFFRFILPHYIEGTSEVHLIFDKQGRQSFDPKFVERKRRDNKQGKVVSHTCTAFTPESKVPTKWMECISCRICKRSIVEAIGLSFMKIRMTRSEQKMVLAGCFSGTDEDVAVVISGTNFPYPNANLTSNAEEADFRVWRHVKQVDGHRVLVYSPDSDVYNIGLGILEEIRKDVIIQVNPLSQDNKYVHLQKLIEAMKRDPDLSAIDKEDEIVRIMQTLFIVSGCDYISYFRSIGKRTFLEVFFQHSKFICGSSTMQGNLSQTFPGTNGEGFLSFLRLIGTVYFSKHVSTFASRYNCSTPDQLFNSIDISLDIKEKHKTWLTKISEVVSTVINSEDERVPTHTALRLHWLRSSWVSMLWLNSFATDVYHNLPLPTENGWKLNEGKYEIQWDDEEVLKKIQCTLDFLSKGCGCKRGCSTNSCGCRKQGHECGPACKCINCKNTPTVSSVTENTSSSEQIEQESNGEQNETESESTYSESESESSSDFYIETEGVNLLEYGDLEEFEENRYDEIVW